jgi:hypothetical protein
MQAVVSRACAMTKTAIKGLPDREGGHTQHLVPSSQDLAASVQSDLTDPFVVVIVVKVIALIFAHRLRCCHVVWMQEVGALITHNILRRGSWLSCAPQSISCGGSTSSPAYKIVQRRPDAYRATALLEPPNQHHHPNENEAVESPTIAMVCWCCSKLSNAINSYCYFLAEGRLCGCPLLFWSRAAAEM